MSFCFIYCALLRPIFIVIFTKKIGIKVMDDKGHIKLVNVHQICLQCALNMSSMCTEYVSNVH